MCYIYAQLPITCLNWGDAKIMGRVGLIGENSIEYINILLDIWNNGDCAVLIDWRIPHQTACEMMDEAGVEKCYIEKKIFNKKSLGVQTKIMFYTFERMSNSANLLPETLYAKFKENYSKSEAIIIYSSGTTGRSKGIILSHYAINTNADAIIDYMNPKKDDCIYIARSISHSSTITGELLVALKTDMKLVVAPVIVPPRFVLRNIEKLGVTILCLNPALLSMYAEEFLNGSYNTSLLKVIYVSGSILSDKIYRLAHKAFNKIQIYNVYGLSETSPRVTAQRKDCSKSNSVGKPIKNIKVMIVDEKGNELSQGEKGIVLIKSPSLFCGYVCGDDKLPLIREGWYNSGDVGYFDKNEELHIVGRIDDVIIIESHKIYPTEVEQVISSYPSIIDCVVKLSACKGSLICEYTYKQDYENSIESELRMWCLNKLIIHEIPKNFIEVVHVLRDQKGGLVR